MKKAVTWLLLVVLTGLAGCSSTTPEYTLKVIASPPNSGTVSVSPSGGKYPRGTLVALTATPTPASGYKFIGWEDEGGNLFSGSPLIVAMYANVKLVAVFTDKPFAVPTVPVSPSPIPTPPLSGKDVFRSDKYHLAVRVPPNWGKAEGPEYNIARPFTGQAAFNSWGEAGFWSHEVIDGTRRTYSGDTIMSQIPQNGAYVVLIEISGGPPPSISSPPAEYTSNNLSGLFKPQDWRLGPASGPGYHGVNFYKWGTGYFLQIVCAPNASDATVADINSILESWQFDEMLSKNTTTGISTRPDIPQGNPIITLDIRTLLGGTFEKLDIYDDGTVLDVKDTFLRMPPPEGPTRVWRKGHIQTEELNGLIRLFQTSAFAGLVKSYNFAENLTPPFSMGDGGYTFTINSTVLQKSVTAFGYLTTTDMPYPLNEIYAKLRAIIDGKTQEVFREHIQ